VVDKLKVLENFSKSDHSVIDCVVVVDTNVKDLVTIRYCYDKAEYDKKVK